eukprot:2242451-Pyramimonas_sp.AAC.2
MHVRGATARTTILKTTSPPSVKLLPVLKSFRLTKCEEVSGEAPSSPFRRASGCATGRSFSEGIGM